MAEDSLEAMTEGKMSEEAELRPVGKTLEEREGKMQRVAEPGTKQLAKERE